MYKYLFGPVPSRRLGMSLGVDLVPRKVCSLDCVYCEAGKTTKLTTQRMEYMPFSKVKEELEHYFTRYPDPDFITFSGSGEPTLNSRIGEVLDYIKSRKPDIPVAVLTNGTLFHDPEVRKELMNADLVLPSLDSASAETFAKINRPDAELKMEEYIDGLVAFSQEFNGKIWLEVLILPGFNDNAKDLEALKEAIGRIRTNAVQLNTLDRPGTECDLKAASLQELRNIAAQWELENVEIIAKPKKRKQMTAYRDDTENTILETLRRRPCTAEDLSNVLGLHLAEINKYLDVLEAENKIRHKIQNRGVFYRLKGE